MPPLPKSFELLQRDGYTYGGSGYCRKCRARIIWYRTPRGKMMPFNEDAEPHHATCPNASDFRKEFVR